MAQKKKVNIFYTSLKKVFQIAVTYVVLLISSEI